MHEAKRIELERQIDNSTIIAEDFNTALTATDRIIVKKKISKSKENMNNTVNLSDIIDIYRMLYPTK